MIWVTVHASCMQLQISEPNPQSRFFSSDERRLCTNYSTQSSLHLHAVYGFTYYNYMYYMYIKVVRGELLYRIVVVWKVLCQGVIFDGLVEWDSILLHVVLRNGADRTPLSMDL